MHKFFKNNRNVIGVVSILFFISASCIEGRGISYNVKAAENEMKDYNEFEMKAAIEGIYDKRSEAFITGDILSLKPLFDTSQKYGQWALEHEVKRIKYLRDWSKERGMKFTKVTTTTRIKKIFPGSKVVKLALEETYKFDYIYPSDAEPDINSFGVGIRHTTSLVRNDNEWKIYNDWYTDCFEDALQAYSGDIQSNAYSPDSSNNALTTGTLYSNEIIKQFNLEEPPKKTKRKFYDREKAVAYADKYCGAAWGSGNKFKYNKKYKDFNGIGGDCTNYASQVLGDKEGGGMPFGGGWHCSYSKYGGGQGSRAWVNADGLKNFILGSGRGSVIKRGTFKELTAPSGDNARGAVAKLQLGDLVCYEKKGDIDHFAVVTGFDSHGYPLINSHTTDRYHVPWDLGWGDNRIRFFLIHING